MPRPGSPSPCSCPSGRLSFRAETGESRTLFTQRHSAGQGVAPRMRRQPSRMQPALGLLAWLVLATGCAAPGGEPSGGRAAEGVPGQGRGAPGGRQPATVQVQETPDKSAVLYTVLPHMRAGSLANPPLVITSIGAARERGSQTAQFSVLVEVTNSRGYGGFTHAETRQNLPLRLQQLQRSRNCQAASSCPYTEAVMVTVRGDDMRALAGSNAGLRFRLQGSGGMVETAVPGGHIRALLAALAAPQE